MRFGPPSDERDSLIAAASAVAGGGLILWSLTSLLRSRMRTGLAPLAGVGGAMLLARASLGVDPVALARTLLGHGHGEAPTSDLSDDDLVDIASMDSFPASDPPSSTGSTARVTSRDLLGARRRRR